jgi:hypothetical protein
MEIFNPEAYIDKAGPQYEDKDEFTRKMRRHQCLWRAYKGFEYGIYRGKELGCYLKEGKNKPHNFLSKECFDYANYRLQNKINSGELWESDRLFTNMLSSQTLCLNLFYPLYELSKSNKPQLVSLLKSSMGIVLSEINEIKIEKALPRKEWVDSTGLDVFVSGKDLQGLPVIYSIEVKYTDVLGENLDSIKVKDNIEEEKRKKALRRKELLVLANEYAIIKEGVTLEEKNTHWQLFRNLLLASRFASDEGHSNIHQLVVAPNGHRSTLKEIESMKNILTDTLFNRIKHVPIQSMVANLAKEGSPDFINYYRSFQVRYFPDLANKID